MDPEHSASHMIYNVCAVIFFCVTKPQRTTFNHNARQRPPQHRFMEVALLLQKLSLRAHVEKKPLLFC